VSGEQGSMAKPQNTQTRKQ